MTNRISVMDPYLLRVPSGAALAFFGSSEVWFYYGKPFNGTIIEKYQTGQIRCEKSIKDGKLDGATSWYYINSIVEFSESYKEGKKDGIFKTYSKYGKLYLQQEFKNDAKISEFKREYRGYKRPLDKWPNEKAQSFDPTYPVENEYSNTTDSPYYNDDLDMDQQSQEFWDDIG